MINKHSLKKLIFMSVPACLLAQEEPKSYILNKSVVSASGFAQDLKDAPASISVITQEELADRPYRDLGEAISTLPGVSIETGVGKTGGYNISIRGMPADYTLILTDGKRQNVTSAAFPNGFTEVFTSFMPPLAAIERIEVISGPMSTLYGSDAIGGIVNVITKKNFDRFASSFSLEMTLQEEKLFGNTYSGSFYTSGPLDKAKKWGFALRGREYYRDFVPTADLEVVPSGGSVGRNGVVGLSESNVYDVGGRISYAPNGEDYYYLDYQNGLQYYNNKQSLLGTAGAKGGYANHLYFMRNNLTLAHLGAYAFGSTDTSIQYLSTSNQGRLITQDAVPTGSPLVGKDRGLRGDDVLADTKLVINVGSSKLTLGGRYWFASMRDRAVVGHSFMYQHNASLFAENEIAILQDLFLTLGVRENYNSAFGFNTSPRAYLVYNTTDWLTLKGGISTGYKTPTVSQLVRGVNGLTAQGMVPTYGNPDLKPESSINFELGFLSETDYTDMGVMGFYNTFSDKIQSVSVAKDVQIPVAGAGVCAASSGNCSYNENADSAIAYGTEVFLGIKPFSVVYGTLGLNLNYTFTKSRQTSGKAKGLPLSDVPAHSLNTALNFAIANLGLYLRTEYRAQQLRTYIGGRAGSSASSLSALEQFLKSNPTLSPYYHSYWLLHLGGHYAISKNLRLHMGVYNLLNHNFVDYSPVNMGGKNSSPTYVNNYNYIREGRRYFLALNMDF
ncbi:hypothetical protein BKH46_04310 [Helicobacter sp. 12S02634-8]|uniref:TonB-dependent receptor domain-containing protein n=1 Tax=Helicobacter sp. 12S02634-8 TaxID=1476199 RepID=UPI000BA507FB|nr:TonB-dependent receptor [Helicobacter sp. 12S02634-8]PAF47313.1 hypothetical protein BKH46_04310 [Helicobacter sp. 12S02634-8]